MNILGISCYYHDAASALVMNGKLKAVAQEERFTRRKNDPRFPSHAISYCLKHASLTMSDLDAVVFYEKPFWKFHRVFMSSLSMYPRTLPFFIASMRSTFSEKLWIKRKILDSLDVSSEQVYFVPHHLSHAASSFYCSPFRESAIVTIDGVGEWATTTIGSARGNEINILKVQDFPHSLGLLYSAFTAFLGFAVNEGEYKVMGMAPFGKPRYKDKVYKVVTRFRDGSFKLNLDYFLYHVSESSSYSRKFVSLFGKPRTPGGKFFTKKSGYPSYFGKKPKNYQKQCSDNQRYADIAI